MAPDEETIYGFFGETNLDEMAESVERGLQNVAESSQKAAAGSEDMEKSMDSATEAVATLGGTSEDLEEDLKDVEDELEDIVSDSGAATASLQILNGSMQSVDDADIDIDFDDGGIDAITEKWQNMRNEIEDFDEQQPRIPLTKGRAEDVSPSEELAFQEMQDEFRDIRDSVQRRFAARDRFDASGPDPFRQLPPGVGDTDRSRSSIIDALQFDDEDTIGPMQVGSLLSRSDERTLSKLAASISDIDGVVSSQQEVMELLDETIIDPDSIDPTPALPPADDKPALPAPNVDPDKLEEALAEAYGKGLAEVDRDTAIPGQRRIPALPPSDLERHRGVGDVDVDRPGDMLAGEGEGPADAMDLDEFRETVGNIDDMVEKGTDRIDRIESAPDQDLLPGADEVTDTDPTADVEIEDRSFKEITDRFGRSSAMAAAGTTGEQFMFGDDRPVDAIDEATEDMFQSARTDRQTFDPDKTGLTKRAILQRSGLIDLREAITGLEEPLEVSGEELNDLRERTSELSERTSRYRNKTRRVTQSLEDLGVKSDRVSDAFTSMRQRFEESDFRTLARGARGGISDGGVLSTLGLTGGAAAANKAGDSTEEFNDGLTNLQRNAIQTSTTLGFLATSLLTYTAGAKTAEEATEELDDEFDKLQATVARLIPALKTVSANLGPFNIGFSNLIVTIPALIATIGPVIGLLGGLAGAALAVAGAFAAVMAVGFMGFTDTLEQNFAGIEDTMGAVEAIAKGMKESLVEALQPLTEVSIGGLGPEGLFVTMLRDIVSLVNMFAEAMAELLGMQVVEEFMLEMRAAILGFSDATAGGMSMMDGLKTMVREALPVLQSLLIWFIDVLPEAMAFFGRIAAEFAPAVSKFGKSLLNLATELTKVGTAVLSVALPALTYLMDGLSILISVVLVFERSIGSASEVLQAFGLTVAALTFVIIRLAAAWNTVLEVSGLLVTGMSTLHDAVDEGDNFWDAYDKSVRNANSSMMIAAKNIAILTIRASLFIAGLYLMADALGITVDIMQLFNTVLNTVLSPFSIVNDLVGDYVSELIPLTEVIQFLIGLWLVATAVHWGKISANYTAIASSMKYSAVLMKNVVVALFRYITATSLAIGATLGLATAEGATTVATNALDASVKSLVASLFSLQFVAGFVVLTAIALLASEMLGLTDVVSTFGEVAIASIVAVSIALRTSRWGVILIAVGFAIIRLQGLFKLLKVVAIATIAAITIALTSSKWGVILLAAGAAIAVLTDSFLLLKVVALGVIAAITAALIGSGWGILVIVIGGIIIGLNNMKKAASGFLQGILRWLDPLGLASGLVNAIINPTVKAWWNTILEGLRAIGNIANRALDSIKDAITNPIETITDLFEWIKTNVIKLLNKVPGVNIGNGNFKAKTAFERAVPGTAPGQAQDGGLTQSEGLAYLHQDEFVIPQDDIMPLNQAAGSRGSSGSGGPAKQIVNVNVDAGSDQIDDRKARRIGQITRNELRRRRRVEDGR